MKQKQLRSSLRTAFTLIELLVVISIIAVLISLTTAAVMQILKKVNELKTRTDIDEMHQALVNYTMKTGLEQPPSRFVLCEMQADYITGMSDPNPAIAQLYSDSYAYLTRLFPRINFGTVQAGPPSWVGVDWNGNGLHDPPVILEGDQCLVFFLGGFNTQGFSTNPANPAQLGGDRLGPYFEFKPVRLVDPAALAATNPQYASRTPSGYRIYLDAYGKTGYAYFSSYKARNGYIRYASLGSDCSLVPQGPYNDGAGNYYNPDSFQIISAGRDTVFGNLPGGIWTPTIAPQIPLAGRDDMANFHDRLLGIR